MSTQSNRILDFVRGLAAVAAIAFILVGVPWLLINVVGMPFGDMIDDLRDPLTSQSIKAAAALRLGLSVIVWAAWLQVSWALLVELLAAIQGRAAGPAPLVLPGFQRSARQLVAVAMLVLTVFSTPAGAVPLTPLNVADTFDAETAQPTASMLSIDTNSFGSVADSVLAGPTIDLTSATSEYHVQPGDSFWSLAEARLGDGFRWREIRQMNEGRVVGNGLTITNQTENLQPGWTLVLPGQSDGVHDELAATTVEQGDHFWALADEKLTSEWGRQPSDDELRTYWAEMVALNQDQLLPPGDPDLIFPGQQLHYPPVPAVSGVTDSGERFATIDAPDEVEAQATAETEAEAPTGPEAEPVDQADSEVSPAEEPAPPSPTSVPESERSIQSSTVAADDAEPEMAPSAGATSEDESNIPLGLVAVSGIGIITAAIGSVIARNQAKRLGARRPGTTPGFELPPVAQNLIDTTSDPEALDALDTALRHLGAELAAADLAQPDLVGALVEQQAIRLLMATPHNAAPEPFTVERDGMVWVAPRPYPTVDVRRAQNPYPLLVSVGHTDSAQLLIDLEFVGAVSLDGGFADVVDLMGTMALELATSPMADTIEVLCVGFAEELADLERVSVVPTLDAALARIEARADEVASLVAASENSGPAGRACGVGDWTPLVVFDPLSDLSEGTVDLVSAARRTASAGVAAVVSTVDGTALTMNLTEDRVSIPAYGVDLDRRALTRTERNALSTAVGRVKQPTARPSANLIELLSNPAAATPDAGADAAQAPVPAAVDRSRRPVMVRLLGPLRIEDHDGGALQFARSATPEFLAYLIHHRDGVEVGRVMNTLWPSTTARRSWIANVHADAGRTLATVGEGVTVTPTPGADDEYRLSDDVGSDLELLQALVSTAVSLPLDAALNQLTEALHLVEGIPYSNITSRWPISEGHWQDATVLVDEAARCVATLALDHFDDPTLAEWATAKGLLASPQSVELHRLRLRAAIALEGGGVGPTGVELSPDAVFQHYQAVAMADDHRPEGGSNLDPQLLELYESYRRSQLASSGHSGNRTGTHTSTDGDTTDWR